MIITVPRDPEWTERFTNLRLKKGTVRFTELGREIPCSKCKDWFPASTEFFHASNSTPTGLHSWCRACYNERFEDTRKCQDR